MTKVFKSKIGLELVIPLMVIFGTILYLMLSDKPSWLGLFILLPVIAIIAHMFVTTNYVIHEDTLTIRCGFLYRKTIDINSIKKISETNNLLSAPATSLDRLEITFGKYDGVIISPKNKQAFITDLVKLNPNIEVKYSKNKTGVRKAHP
jgi:hypothetical protein